MTDFSKVFDKHFQKCFINHLLRDSEFLNHVIDDTEPNLFTDDISQRAARLILDFGKEHQSAPDTLIFRVLDDFKERQLVSGELYTTLNTYLDELFTAPLQNRVFLIKEFDRFIRHQMFRRNIIPAAEFIKRGDFDKAEPLLIDVFSYRAGKKANIGRRLTVDPTDRIIRRRAETGKRFWLLMPEVDAKVDGLKRGELGVWQSQRSSAGKSAALAFLARSFAFQGFKVLIYTMEMGEEAYEDRLDMCIAGLTKEQKVDSHKIHKALTFMTKIGGDIWIKQFPSGVTVNDLKKNTEMLANVEGFHPDAVLVDYADELSPENLSYVDNSFSAGKHVYSSLRAWAVEDQVAIWTGMQSNRPGIEATVADQEHSGESLAKAWIADIILSINRTPKESENNLTRLFVVKNREGGARFTITINTDFSRMQFWTRSD